MNYKTHLVGGLFVGLVGIKALNTVGVDLGSSINEAIFISTSVIGSLLPDIDHKGSYIGRRAKITSSLISSLFEHRGATHSPIIITSFMFILNLLFSKFVASGPIVTIVFLGFYVGMMSHVLLDMVTKGGVPLLLPISKKKFSLTNIKTGSLGEQLIMTGLVLVSLVMMFNTFKVMRI